MWVIQEGLDAETIASLRTFWSGAYAVHFLKMKPLPWYWATETLPLLSWARIEAGELLPPQTSRCIYLDTDTLVGRDLVELFDMPLDGNSIAMAINNNVPAEVATYLDSLGIRADNWFNAGVALIDVDAWRRNSEMDRLIWCKLIDATRALVRRSGSAQQAFRGSHYQAAPFLDGVTWCFRRKVKFCILREQPSPGKCQGTWDNRGCAPGEKYTRSGEGRPLRSKNTRSRCAPHQRCDRSSR